MKGACFLMNEEILDLNTVKKMGTELEHWLRMRVHPIAIKMITNKDEVPKDSIIPTRDWKHKYSQCQSFAKSQRDGLTIAMFKEDNWCPEPVLGYGFADRIPYFLEGNHRYPDSIKNKEDAAVWCRNMPYFEYGKYIGIVSAPVHNCSFMPDLIIMHVNGMMTSQLMIVKNWIDGKDVNCQISGHAVCVYSVVPALLKGDCHVAVPCKGDRRLAGAQDDEIMFSIPPSMLPNFIEGINWLQNKNWGIPMIEEYREEYPLKPGYAKLGEELEMDLKQSSPRSQEFQDY